MVDFHSKFGVRYKYIKKTSIYHLFFKNMSILLCASHSKKLGFFRDAQKTFEMLKKPSRVFQPKKRFW